MSMPTTSTGITSTRTTFNRNNLNANNVNRNNSTTIRANNFNYTTPHFNQKYDQPQFRNENQGNLGQQRSGRATSPTSISRTARERTRTRAAGNNFNQNHASRNAATGSRRAGVPARAPSATTVRAAIPAPTAPAGSRAWKANRGGGGNPRPRGGAELLESAAVAADAAGDAAVYWLTGWCQIPFEAGEQTYEIHIAFLRACFSPVCSSFRLRWLWLALLARAAGTAGFCAAGNEKTFASPGDAVLALYNAAKSNDSQAMDAIFGSNANEILHTGDDVADKNMIANFVRRYDQMHRVVIEPDHTVTLYVGAENWPMPIPIVKNSSGAWYFDTEAGMKEILYRRVGTNENDAIDVLHTLVDAQREYASAVA